MLQELRDYTNFLTDPTKGKVSLQEYVLPVEGLHLLVTFTPDGSVEVRGAPFRAPKKKGERPVMRGLLDDEVMPRTLHIDYVNSNKAIADKKIHSATPYALKLKKQVLLDKAWMDGFAEHVARYFREALKKCRADHTPAQQERVAAFEQYCRLLPARLAELPDKLRQEYEKLKPADYVVVYAADFTPDEFQKLNQNYQEDSMFNKNDYNEKVIVEGKKVTYGLSNFYNGDNSKKPYLQHQTASFSIGSRISQADARALHLFNQLRRYGAFSTNPLPVFLDEPELSLGLVNTVRQEGERAAGFHELMQTLCRDRPGDVGNYYLFYILGGDIRDVDYVSAFRYALAANIEPLFVEEKHGRLSNVFELEKQLLQPLFGNQLVMKLGDAGWRYRYFDDLDFDPKYQTPGQYEAILRYRGAWYDYIYKSRRQAVSGPMFRQLVQELLLDDLRHDEWDASQRRHTREYAIRQKLNRWFSLWDFFDFDQPDPSNPIPTPIPMPNKIEALRERVRAVADTPDAPELETDEEFGFAAGQLIYDIFRKSKADNPTHGMLEPFMQKSNSLEFKKAIKSAFAVYKHEFNFGRGRFGKVFSSVMGYEYDGNVKELMTYILAGYFSKSVLYKSKPKGENSTTPNA